MGCQHSAPTYTLAEAPTFSDTVIAATGGGAETSSGSIPLAGAALEDFLLRDIVGKGGKSIGVQIAYNAKLNHYYAVKIISESAAEKEHWEIQPRDELAALRDVTAASAPFVVPLKAAFERNSKMFLVMDFMAGGELTTRVHGRAMEHDEALFYAAEVALGLEAIHKLGYIYRDLKPENLLLNENGHVFICDLGFAIKQPRSFRKLGTPQYLAPEVLSPNLATEGYTNAVDWYAFGCLLYEMLTGHVAWGGAFSTPDEVFALILANDLVFPRSLSPDARDLITRLLEPNPASRLCTAEAVRAHPFFRRVNWDTVRRQGYAAPWVPPPLRFAGDPQNFDIYMRLEGSTIVSRGAALRVIHEKPVPKFCQSLSGADKGTTAAAAGAQSATGVEAAPANAPVAHGAAAFLRPPVLPVIAEDAPDSEQSATLPDPAFPISRAGMPPPATIPEVSRETDTTTSSAGGDADSRRQLPDGELRIASVGAETAAPQVDSGALPASLSEMPTPLTEVRALESRAAPDSTKEVDAIADAAAALTGTGVGCLASAADLSRPPESDVATGHAAPITLSDIEVRAAGLAPADAPVGILSGGDSAQPSAALLLPGAATSASASRAESEPASPL